jgi:hypothetical protein
MTLMDALQKLVIEAACAAEVVRFFKALDERDHGTCADLMADEGVWERQGQRLRGGAQVLAALEERASGRRTCHSISSLLTTALDERHCTVTFCLTAWDGTEGADGASPPLARLAGIRRCVDELALTERGWKLTAKTSRPLFAGPPGTGAA